MKRVLIISPCDLPVPAVQGGAVQTLIDSIINSNEKNPNFQLIILSSYDENAYRKSKQFKYTKFIFVKHNKLLDFTDLCIDKIIGLKEKSAQLRRNNYLWKLKIIITAKNILKKQTFDDVILQNYGYFTKIFEETELLEKYKDHIFYHLHNDIPDGIDPSIMKEMKCILISNYLSKKILDNYGMGLKQNLLILNNGIAVDKYMHRLATEERVRLREELGFTEKDKVVCFVGRINPNKGIFELLEAMKKIQNTDIKLLVIGAAEFENKVKSEFEDKIRKICNQLGDRIKATGYISHEQIWKYYQVADLAALPSMWEEPAGLTILEALASGLPVITTNAGGIPEFMKKEYGFMLDRDEYLIDNIAEKIEVIAEDLLAWKKKGEKAAQYIVDNYSEEKYFDNFVKIFQTNG